MIDLKALREYANYGEAVDGKVVIELLDMLEKAQKDSARLKFAFGAKKHDSFAIYELYHRVFNGDEPSIDEVREAIDAAMQS